jgi:hypothetical protein
MPSHKILLPTSLLLLLTSHFTAQAQDILFYEEEGCNGNYGASCIAMPEAECCDAGTPYDAAMFLDEIYDAPPSTFVAYSWQN